MATYELVVQLIVGQFIFWAEIVLFFGLRIEVLRERSLRRVWY